MKKYSFVYAISSILSVTVNSAIAAGNNSDGLPQLDITTWPTQLFWLVITFGFGYILISTFVVPSMSTVLEGRTKKISDDLEKAKKAQEEAKNMFNLREASLNDARTKATNSVTTAIEQAKLETAKRDAAVNKKLAANAKKAEEKISKIREESLLSLNELATEISQKIITDLTPLKVQKSVIKKYVSAQSKLVN